jgi:hypothetical protein
MTEQTTTTNLRGAFGETLEALMRSRGIEPGPDEVRDLARRAGMEPDRLLACVLDDKEQAGYLDGLARELSLDAEEMMILADAYTWSASGVEAIRVLHEGKLCSFWRRSGDAVMCWREATVPYRLDNPEGPKVCAEHKLVYDLEDEAEGYLESLQGLHEWIREGPEKDRTDRLRDVAYGQRDELERLYLGARIKADAARMVADQDQGETPRLDLEMAQEIARTLICAEALVNARATLEDLPDEVVPPGLDRFATCAALMTFEAKADEAAEREIAEGRRTASA